MTDANNVDNLYLIAGRIEGSACEDVRVVESDEGLCWAKLLFINWLADRWCRLNRLPQASEHEIPEVKITCARPLTDMVDEPIRDDAHFPTMRVHEPQDDHVVIPGD